MPFPAIASGKPALRVGQRYQRAVPPVAGSHALRFDPDFTVNDLRLSARQRTAHVRIAVSLFCADGRGKLGEAVAAVRSNALFPGLLRQRHGNGRPAEQHRFQCDVAFAIQETPELGRHQRGVGAAA